MEQVHDAAELGAGVVVNPGAWTHYAYAIRDALDFLEIPVVEVHISDVHAREPWRRNSVISDVVQHRVDGRGIEGYRDAIAWLANGACAVA